YKHQSTTTQVSSVAAFGVVVVALAQDTEKIESVKCSASTDDRTNNELARIASRVKDITKVYEIGDVIGEGGFGQVYRAKRRSNGKQVALKRIPKEWTESDEFQREVNALCRLNDVAGGHPHICQMYDVFEDDDEYWLSMELIEGGEVFEHLIENGAYSEAMAATFLRQFAEGLAFMHSAGVVHADLKPENLMLSSWDEEKAEVKLVDFGCSLIVSNKDPTEDDDQSYPSTVAYDPPEKIINKSAPNFKSDVWAAGCILYIILTGSHPFDKYSNCSDEEIAEKLRSIGLGKTKLADVIFDERTALLSPSVISLLRHMLHPDPEKRTTAERFRRNRWVQGLTASWEVLDRSDERLELFWQRELRKSIFKKFGDCLDEDRIREIFQRIDDDGNGEIDFAELSRVLQSAGAKKKDIQNIFNAANLDKEGGISFNEFKTVLMSEEPPELKDRQHYQKAFRTIMGEQLELQQKGRMTISWRAAARRLFASMDLDHNGALDCHELRTLLRRLGVDERDISFLVASVDLNKDGSLSFDEFTKVIFRAQTGKTITK
ncbi:hypothetical protein ACHAWC_001535, partial [Mediolabrus comicus]